MIVGKNQYDAPRLDARQLLKRLGGEYHRGAESREPKNEE
jgi:hypothetical protein